MRGHPAPPVICAIVPAYNEEGRVGITVDAIRTRKQVSRVVVVDDGSTDKTADEARAAGAEVIVMPRNGGKGAALTRGYQEVREQADIVLLLDADLRASAAECVKLLPPLIDNRAQMAIGILPPDPAFAATGQSGGGGWVVRLARWGIARRTGRVLEQPLSGQRAVRREVLEKLGGTFASGFGVEVALTVRTLRAGFTVIEEPTEFRHEVTGSDVAGVLHRARQFCDVAKVVLTTG